MSLDGPGLERRDATREEFEQRCTGLGCRCWCRCLLLRLANSSFWCRCVSWDEDLGCFRHSGVLQRHQTLEVSKALLGALHRHRHQPFGCVQQLHMLTPGMRPCPRDVLMPGMRPCPRDVRQGTARLDDAHQGHVHRIVTADPLNHAHLGGVPAPERDDNADRVLYRSNDVHLLEALQRHRVLWNVVEYASLAPSFLGCC